MCVTSKPAAITNTQAFVYSMMMNGVLRHVVGYQNKVEYSRSGNCMFLNFAGKNLELVRGAENTATLMGDITRGLPSLVQEEMTRARASLGGGLMGVSVEKYGDYTVILAQGPADIRSALNQVELERRPVWDDKFAQMIDFYMRWNPTHTFALACFDGSITPTHPICVSYEPHDANVLTIPGLDGHDGNIPKPDQLIYRDFTIAFGAEGVDLPHKVLYSDFLTRPPLWLPTSVAGFRDNRRNGPNGDYVIPLSSLLKGLTGTELAATLL